MKQTKKKKNGSLSLYMYVCWQKEQSKNTAMSLLSLPFSELILQFFFPSIFLVCIYIRAEIETKKNKSEKNETTGLPRQRREWAEYTDTKAE